MHNLQGGVSDYNCTCVAGWEGQNCDIDANDCILNPCQNGATCNVSRGVYNVQKKVNTHALLDV